VQQARRQDDTVVVLAVRVNELAEAREAMEAGDVDSVQRELVERMLAGLGPEATLARWDANDFLVVAAGRAEESTALRLARALVEAVDRPFRSPRGAVHLTLSIGASAFPQHGASAERLLDRATSARRSIRDPGNAVAMFEGGQSDRFRESFVLSSGIRSALEREELTLVYQPKACLRTGRLVGVEALVRWRHPELGVVSPEVFVPAAEASGTVDLLGEWVLSEALSQAAGWRDALEVTLPVAVNLSALQLVRRDLSERVRQALEAHPEAASLLHLEVTEGALIEDRELAREVMLRLRDLGLRLALDDFGTGFSSLSYLRQLPVDEVKLDRSFITDLESDAASGAIVAGVVSMVHALGKTVVVEGIESVGQLERLRELGVDVGQGYVLGAPTGPEVIAELAARQPLAPWSRERSGEV
jgi:EAL domain-containing protein (putative c-di-GMP-specific phosphodiesterase class I)/GGDEF domain-containing protein